PAGYHRDSGIPDGTADHDQADAALHGEGDLQRHLVAGSDAAVDLECVQHFCEDEQHRGRLTRLGDIGCGRYDHDHGHLGRCLREYHADRDGRDPVNDYSDTDHSEHCERDDPAIHGHGDL